MGCSITWLVTLYGMSQNPTIRDTRAKFTFANYYALKIGMRTSTMAALTGLSFFFFSFFLFDHPLTPSAKQTKPAQSSHSLCSLI